MFELSWHVFLRVKDEAKAHTLLSRIEECLGLRVNVLECKRYWKDPELYEVTFSNSLDIATGNVTAAVYESLILAGRLGHGWEIQAPRTYENGEVEFSGLRSSQSSDFAVTGLTWASFSLSSVPRIMHNTTDSLDDT